jgi:hypothetical protein
MQFWFNQVCCFWEEVFIHFPKGSYIKKNWYAVAANLISNCQKITLCNDPSRNHLHYFKHSTVVFNNNTLRCSQSNNIIGSGSHVEFWIDTKIINSDEVHQKENCFKVSFYFGLEDVTTKLPTMMIIALWIFIVISFRLFCVHWSRWKVLFCFCWCWWNCWASLIKVYFYN